MIFFFPRDMWSIAGGYTYYIYKCNLNPSISINGSFFKRWTPVPNCHQNGNPEVGISKKLGDLWEKIWFYKNPGHCRYFIPIYPQVEYLGILPSISLNNFGRKTELCNNITYIRIISTCQKVIWNLKCFTLYAQKSKTRIILFNKSKLLRWFHF